MPVPPEVDRLPEAADRSPRLIAGAGSRMTGQSRHPKPKGPCPAHGTIAGDCGCRFLPDEGPTGLLRGSN